MKNRLNSYNKDDYKYIIILMLIFSLFVVIWYNIAIYRLYHLYSAVYDLGISAERIWLPLHSKQSFIGILYNIFYGSIIPYILSPISVVTTSLKFILFIQTIFIWLSVFPLYLIAKKKGLTPFVSLLISVSLFFYFPMAGLNFFDFHMMAFFPFFFLTAYTFYIYGKDWLSLIFFLIATLTKFPFDIFILIFALEELLLYIYLNRKNKTAKFKILSIPVILLVFSSGSLIAGELLSLIGPSNISNFAHFSNVAVFPFGQIILTFFIIFGVVLFIPLYSKRWVFFFVPYTILVILAQNQAYYFPGVFTDQYSVLYYPFIFLGLIDVIASRKLKEESITKSTKNNHKHKFNISNSMKTIVPIFIILLLMSAAFQPWSPAIKNNAYINYYHNDCNPQQAYQTYIYLSEESKLIPQTNPYVLVTNDIPEAYPRALINGPYRVGELVMGFPSPVFENISIQDAVNNTFPYITWNGTVINIPIDYAWAISTSAVFNAKSGTQSMSEIIQVMLASGKYGIIAQADGTILLMRNYMGSPILYTPINYNIQTNDVPDPALYTIINKLYNYSN